VAVVAGTTLGMMLANVPAVFLGERIARHWAWWSMWCALSSSMARSKAITIITGTTGMITVTTMHMIMITATTTLRRART
jgi:hypothetical protein